MNAGAGYAWGNFGPNTMNESSTNNFENAVSSPSPFVSEISHDSPYPDISDLFHVPPEDDPSIYDFASANTQPSETQVFKLAEWQEGILRLWAAQHHRAASDREMLFFHGLLKLPENVIEARLCQLFEENEALRSALISGEGTSPNPHACFVNGTQTIIKSFGTGIEASEAPTLFQSEDASQSISQSFNQHDPAVESTVHQFGALQPSQPQDILTRYTSSFTARNSTKSHNINGATNPVSLCSPVHDLSHQISAVPHPSTHVHQNQLLVVTQAILVLIRNMAKDRTTHGCGPIRSHEIQIGRYPCKLGCGRRFKTSSDLFRHEAIVYPQNWFFCFICGDANNPSEKYLFTREDKLRRHCKDHHPNTAGGDAYRVANAPSTFPEICPLCSHYRHRNWKDRCEHIVWHCKRGDDFANVGKEEDALLPFGEDNVDDNNRDNKEQRDGQSDPPYLEDKVSGDDLLSDDSQPEGDHDQDLDASVGEGSQIVEMLNAGPWINKRKYSQDPPGHDTVKTRATGRMLLRPKANTAVAHRPPRGPLFNLSNLFFVSRACGGVSPRPLF